METSAQLSNARVTPRKARQLVDVIVGLSVNEALGQLTFNDSKVAKITSKLLRSAIANAENNEEMKRDNLRIKSMDVGDGIKFKRWQPVSRGMGHSYVKRNSHLTLVLEEIKPTKKKRERAEADITTLSMEELEAVSKKQEPEKIDRKSSKKEGRDGPGPEATGEASGKIKAQQQGGDKKKTHRRKSI